MNTDISHTLTLYQSGTKKLTLPLDKAISKTTPWLLHGSPKLYINDTSAHLVSVCHNCDSLEECCDLFRITPELQNWHSNTPIPSKKTYVKVTYRVFNMIPVDTSNYKSFNREGKWIGEYEGNKYFIYYLNDKKHGEARINYSDGSYFSAHFDKGNLIDVPNFYFPEHKQKWKKRKAPGVLSAPCIHPIGP